jgi:phosphoribosyl 1,2-cyclic phosphate phosphodiesterase
LPILGFRIGNFAYITDASYIPDQEWSKLNGLDLLIINALRTEIHDSHFNLAQAVEAAQKIKSKRTVFTHVGHQMGLYARINSSLAQGMELAFDQMSINV